MNQQIRDNLYDRAVMLENLESIMKSCSNKNSSQLSLFDDISKETISLKMPENVNYDEMIQKEVDVLGVSLTYNIQDRYILHSRRFCNHTLRTINELTESQDRIVFIGRLDDIEYKKSLAGNNYGRIIWRDYDSECRMFLFGDSYQKLISRAFKNRYYLCECSYNNDKNSLSIVNFRPIEDINIEEYVSTIIIEPKDKYHIFSLREYVFGNMIGGGYNLIFLYEGQELVAPYKVRFTEENYCDIKDLIKNINVRYDR